MSRSPRRLLRRAADALAALRDVEARYPDARAELARGLGERGMADLARATDVVQTAADAIDRDDPSRATSSPDTGLDDGS